MKYKLPSLNVFNSFHNCKDGIELIVENGFVTHAFAENIKLLCSEDPTMYIGQSVHFKFHKDEPIWKLMEFVDRWQKFEYETKDNNGHE